MLGTPATCTEAGLTDGVCCDRCGEILTEQEEIPALGHTWDEGVVTKEATEESGEITYTCETCAETRIEEFEYEPSDPEPTEPEQPTEPEELTEPEPTEPSDPENEITRLYGSGRCETALAIANEMKEILGIEYFDTIIIASGNNFADALAGSYLAAQNNASILLYHSSSVSMNLAYIQENLSKNGIVYLLGGSAAIPSDVERDLADAGISFKRLSGSSRFDTNLEILSEADVWDSQEILVATGYSFAGSLSASATGLPILMVNNYNGELTESQIAFLDSLEGCTFTIIGDTSAVSNDLENILAEYGNVTRFSGKDREATSILVANSFFRNPDPTLSWPTPKASLAASAAVLCPVFWVFLWFSPQMEGK